MIAVNGSARNAALCLAVGASVALALVGCSGSTPAAQVEEPAAKETVSDRPADAGAEAVDDAESQEATGDDAATAAEPEAASNTPGADDLRASLAIVRYGYADLDHGPKPAEYQKYIVLHDTEGDSNARNTIDWWESNGNLVASHFVVDKDGTITQCVDLDRIAHHAGFGDAGKNARFGVEDESRDDKLGTVPIGSSHPDYGMNSYSIGIEMVHVGGSGDYPEAQLEAVDGLIEYIDAYYGFQSTIIDHKAWRDGNSDTSPEFASYLANYQQTRTHDGQPR